MAAKKKAAAVRPTSAAFTGTGAKNIRNREKVLGTPKGQQQSKSRISRREQGERGAKRRIAADVKKMQKLDKARASGKVSGSQHRRETRRLRRSMAVRARLSQSAASGAG